MGRGLDLTGQVVGRLTVICEVPKPEGAKSKCKYWLCKCSCGNEKILDTGVLRHGNTKSCGCLASEILFERCKKYNEYDLTGEYGICFASNSDDKILFDLEDYDLIKDYCWCVRPCNHGRGTYKSVCTWKCNTSGNKRQKLSMHRVVLGVEDLSIIVDHINRNPLDNRKSNLRTCTAHQNSFNSGTKIDNKYKGVFQYRDGVRWVAQIGFDYHTHHLGIFDTPEQAALAYNEAAKKYYGEFAYLNDVHLEDEIKETI